MLTGSLCSICQNKAFQGIPDAQLWIIVSFAKPISIVTGKAQKQLSKNTVGTLDETPKNPASAGPKVFKTAWGHKVKKFKTSWKSIFFNTRGADLDMPGAAAREPPLQKIVKLFLLNFANQFWGFKLAYFNRIWLWNSSQSTALEKSDPTH